MSFRHLEAVRLLETRISHTEKLVLLMLAHHANDDGTCFPSLSTLAKECSLSRFGVIKTLKKLKKGGLVEWVHESHRSKTYKLLVNSKISASKVVNHVDQRWSTLLTRVVNHVDQGGQPCLPKLTVTDTELKGGMGIPPSKLTSTERISLEREREELKKRHQSLYSDSMSEPERAERKTIKTRIQKIDKALFIAL